MAVCHRGTKGGVNGGVHRGVNARLLIGEQQVGVHGWVCAGWGCGWSEDEWGGASSGSAVPNARLLLGEQQEAAASFARAAGAPDAVDVLRLLRGHPNLRLLVSVLVLVLEFDCISL